MYCDRCRAPKQPHEVGRSQSGIVINYFCTKCASTIETRMLCGACDAEKSPTITLNGRGQIVHACPECQASLGPALSRALAGTGKAVGDDRDEPLRATVNLDPSQIVA